MHTGETWRLGRRPALDGLRGVAILLVLAAHAAPDWFHGGGAAGVTLFFVLSGFLITSLLLEERHDTGRIRFGAFYLRRARRLMPALWAMLVGVLVLSAAGLVTVTAGEWWSSALYVENLHRLIGGPDGVLGHTWSLAMEEQFYLAWPALLLAATMAGRRLPRTVGVAALAVVTVGLLVGPLLLLDPMDPASWARIYFGPDARAASLAAGCLLAAWMTGRPERAFPAAATWAGVAAMLVLGVIGWGAFKSVFVPMAATIVAVPMIRAAATGGGWLAAPWLRLVGRRSYALYLWQPVVFAAVVPRIGGAGGVVAAVVLSWLVALASWRWVESRVLGSGRSRSEESVEDPLARPHVRHDHVVHVAGELRRAGGHGVADLEVPAGGRGERPA